MGFVTLFLLVGKIVVGAVSHLGDLVTVVKGVFSAGLGVFTVIGNVAKALYGVTQSAAGSVALADVAHIAVMLLVYFGSALSFSSWMLNDVASGLAWLAAGVAGFVTWLHKLGSAAPVPLKK